jgi:hypothetical protein
MKMSFLIFSKYSMTQRKNGECAKETNTKAQPTEIHQAKKNNMSDYLLFSMIL